MQVGKVSVRNRAGSEEMPAGAVKVGSLALADGCPVVLKQFAG